MAFLCIHDRKVMAPLKRTCARVGCVASAGIHDRKVMAPLKPDKEAYLRVAGCRIHDRKVMAPLKPIPCNQECTSSSRYP